MRILAFVTLLLALSGCAAFRQELPPWARPAPAGASPAEDVSADGPETTSPAPPATPASAGTSPPVAPPPPMASPAPLPPAPARPPAAPGAPPPTHAPLPGPAAATPPPAPPASPSPPLTASLSPAEVRRLQDETNRRIEEAERLLRQLDGRPLAPTDQELLRLAQGLVEQARRALGGQEYERAANLAAKARTLADDLSSRR
jgi:hypothetical protein